MKLYNTVEKEGTAEQTIERSRFIAYVKPVSSKEEADDFVAEIRRKHRDATQTSPPWLSGTRCRFSGLPTTESLRELRERPWLKC